MHKIQKPEETFTTKICNQMTEMRRKHKDEKLKNPSLSPLYYSKSMDIGTSSTAICYESTEFSLPTSASGEKRGIRTVMFIKEHNQQHTKILFGDDAINEWRDSKDLRKKNFVYHLKRVFGLSLYEAQESETSKLTYDLVEEDFGQGLELCVQYYPKPGEVKPYPCISVQEIYIQYIRHYVNHLKNRNSYSDEEALNGWVFPFPVSWTHDLKRVYMFRNCIQKAGIQSFEMNHESTFAILANVKEHAHKKKTLVIDIGDGTLDITLAVVNSSYIRVIAMGGNGDLGGKDFTLILLEMVAKKMGYHPSSQSLKDFFGNEYYQKAFDKAENIKLQLCAYNSPYEQVTFWRWAGKEMEQEVTIQRDEYLKECEGLAQKVYEHALQVIASASINKDKINKDEIHQCFMVGGTGAHPTIKKIITQNQLAMEIDRVANCDYHVASGAVSYGCISQLNMDEFKAFKEIRDVEGRLLSFDTPIIESAAPFSIAAVLNNINPQTKKMARFPLIFIHENTPVPESVPKGVYLEVPKENDHVGLELVTFRGNYEEKKTKFKPLFYAAFKIPPSMRGKEVLVWIEMKNIYTIFINAEYENNIKTIEITASNYANLSKVGKYDPFDESMDHLSEEIYTESFHVYDMEQKEDVIEDKKPLLKILNDEWEEPKPCTPSPSVSPTPSKESILNRTSKSNKSKKKNKKKKRQSDDEEEMEKLNPRKRQKKKHSVN